MNTHRSFIEWIHTLVSLKDKYDSPGCEIYSQIHSNTPSDAIYAVNSNNTIRTQGREGGAADGTGERKVSGTEPVSSTDSSVCRELVAAAGNNHS